MIDFDQQQSDYNGRLLNYLNAHCAHAMTRATIETISPDNFLKITIPHEADLELNLSITNHIDEELILGWPTSHWHLQYSGTEEEQLEILAEYVNSTNGEFRDTSPARYNKLVIDHVNENYPDIPKHISTRMGRDSRTPDTRKYDVEYIVVDFYFKRIPENPKQAYGNVSICTGGQSFIVFKYNRKKEFLLFPNGERDGIFANLIAQRADEKLKECLDHLDKAINKRVKPDPDQGHN